ncbi:MAG: carcinine hydrolase/isopenicillin-N N-acyltransferase family protein [Dysgonomonas sp.]
MKHLYSIILLLLAACLQTEACTTAIISGKYTADGRPLLYKHRDTSSLQNKLMHFNDGKYSYVGIVNSSDKEGKEVWGGYNTAGFAIMNSASYNINPTNDGNEEREGIVMKMALQHCASLADFEKMLSDMPKPMQLSANFGVIDANGGAAYYETNDIGYKKFDANDPSTAPLGYIIRTNFSFSGDRNRDMGLSRYQSASDLFYKASLANGLSYKFLLQDVSRCLTHGITGVDLYSIMPENGDKPTYYPFRDFIPRYSTSSVIVVQGVKDKKAVEQTTMWTILGSPLTTPAIPIWLNKNEIYPSVMIADETGNAKLCDWGLTLKKRLFPIERGEGKDYVSLTTLVSKDKKGVLQRILSIENQILDYSEKTIKKWSENGYTKDNMSVFYSEINKKLEEYFNL